MTDQPKWTPGAWAVNPKAATNVEAGRRGVAACGGYFDNTSDGAYVVENEANAHLIAAAPDMAGVSPRAAEMLRVAATFLRSEEPTGTVFYDGAACDAFCIADDCEAAADDINAALAKARGQA